MDVTKCALTTIDNPYDPFDQFTEWMLYDEEERLSLDIVSWSHRKDIG